MPTSTPWGRSQTSNKIAHGIISYCTSGHGGIHLSTKRQAEFKALFPDFCTWIRGGEWFEEDCDTIVIVLAFPEFFDEKIVHRAFNIAYRDEYFDLIKKSAKWAEYVKKYEQKVAG